MRSVSARTAPLVVSSLLFAATLLAGPPFVTDDPEPVDFHHWEVYLASQPARDPDGWSGTAPHVEVNYGPIHEVQLHIIAPMAFTLPREGSGMYGFGDVELGAKVRFVDEGASLPQIGIFPLLEVPSGNAAAGLGAGKTQALLPVWVQKSFGQWLTYGGGGYWINPGTGNRNWWFTGILLQRQVSDDVAIGGEIFHATPRNTIEYAETRFNIGAIIDVSELHHILVSAGRTLQAEPSAQFYLAWQLTFGPAS